MNQIDYSVVVPVFNSDDTVEELFDRLQIVFAEINKTFEVIFVDDGSLDGSWKVLSKLKKEFPDHITAIRLNMNYGQHNATFCGFNYVNGRHVITLDDDLQHPPEEIKKMIDANSEGNYDLVYGVFDKKQHSNLRNFGSRVLRYSSRKFWNRPGQGSSFRLISSNLIQKILSHNQNFIFIDEILHWYTEDEEFVLVEHRKRLRKRSGYRFSDLIRLVFNVAIYYTNLPIRIMVYFGFMFSVFFLLVALGFVAIKIFASNVPLGYTSLIVAILGSTSLILFSLGIIGEYLSRIYMAQSKKPPYSIKKIL